MKNDSGSGVATASSLDWGGSGRAADDRHLPFRERFLVYAPGALEHRVVSRPAGGVSSVAAMHRLKYGAAGLQWRGEKNDTGIPLRSDAHR